MRYQKILTIWLVAVALAVVGHAQSHLQTLRAASGALTAADDPDAVDSIGPNVGREVYTRATITLDVTTLTLADADDEVDFYIQTLYGTDYNGDPQWVDTENIHFNNSDNGATATRVITIDGTFDGPGTTKSIIGTNPAAGSELSETVPANTIWSVQSISALMVTDANAADRRVRTTLDDGSTVFYQVSSSTNHTASLTVRYVWSPLGAPAVGVVAATDATINIPLPKPTILSAANRFITVTGALEAGDNWGAPQLSVEEWHDPLVLTDGTIRDNVRSYGRPLGSQVRIKTAVTGASAGTYAYSATVFFK